MSRKYIQIKYFNELIHFLKMNLHFVFSLLICAVFTISCVFVSNTNAQSYEITAVVNPLPPLAPPTITSPTNLRRFAIPTVAVTGTCSSDTQYVVINRNGTAAAASTCANGIFTIEVGLVNETNNLEARAFNTGGEGAKSMPVVLYYKPEEVIALPTPAFLAGNTRSTQPFIPSVSENQPYVQPASQPASNSATEKAVDYRLQAAGVVTFAVTSSAALFQIRRIRMRTLKAVKDIAINIDDEK